MKSSKRSFAPGKVHSIVAGAILIASGGAVCFGLLRLAVAFGEFVATYAVEH